MSFYSDLFKLSLIIWFYKLVLFFNVKAGINISIDYLPMSNSFFSLKAEFLGRHNFKISDTYCHIVLQKDNSNLYFYP